MSDERDRVTLFELGRWLLPGLLLLLGLGLYFIYAPRTPPILAPAGAETPVP